MCKSIHVLYIFMRIFGTVVLLIIVPYNRREVSLLWPFLLQCRVIRTCHQRCGALKSLLCPLVSQSICLSTLHWYCNAIISKSFQSTYFILITQIEDKKRIYILYLYLEAGYILILTSGSRSLDQGQTNAKPKPPSLIYQWQNMIGNTLMVQNVNFRT